ncbi:MAG: phage tail protein [Chloroflexi bacterium]|nr:phage tail protein [Chloroflexota bacterium]MCI0580785.1 phage tail protein [Chloroflexota bacterium]MCI0648692.1 phage tail protein [Chloroflexota bacterium]MCI0731511.1 phage tail protein [Chloroflexota bacterium]
MKRTEIERLLPGVFQRTILPGNPLSALLEVMESLHTPSETVLAQLDTFFNPYLAPAGFVPFIAGWLDLERFLAQAPEKLDARTAEALFPAGLGRLRELVATAAFLSKWRGTARGLIRFLETATGITGYTIEEQVPGKNNQPQPFHIRVAAPQEAAVYQALIERIIELEKPAYVTYELLFRE